MKSSLRLVAVFLLGMCQTVFAATPLVEFIAVPSANQSIKPGNTALLFYTIRNNTNVRFPLTYSLPGTATIVTVDSTCSNFIAPKSTCSLVVRYQAPAANRTEPVNIQVNYQGRAPITNTVTFTVDSNIACSLLSIASYQTPFCQQQYQKVIQYTPNVFNLTDQNVQEEQTLGGMFGIYQRLGSGVEQICYVSCGLSELNGQAPNQNTLFELASVTKTFTTSILGKLVYNSTIPPATTAIAPYLPPAFSLGANESPVTFQELATFSGGVCFSDAPSVNQQSTDQAVNQANFVIDINNLNPDPASGACANGDPNVRPVYATPPYLPTINFYSNSSVGLLGQGLMNTQGFDVLEPGFNDWMCLNITNVLGMTQTNGCLPDEAKNGSCGTATTVCSTGAWTASEYASGYHINQQTYQLGTPFLYLPWAPAGGIRSNAVDMIQFIRANLGYNATFSIDETQLIQGMNIAHQPNNYLPAPGVAIPNIGSQFPLRGGQGYAWVCEQSPTNSADRICGKIGGHTNFRSFLGLNLNQNYGVIILFNTGANSTNGSIVAANTPPSVGQIGANLLENIS